MKKWQKALSAFIVAAAMSMGVGTAVGCGKKDKNHEHTYKAEWSKDKEGHWHASDCGHDDSEKQAHVDSNNDGKCDVCDYVIPSNEEPPVHEHTWSTDWTQGTTTHWHSATCEGHTNYKKDEAAHVDENEDDKCDVCGADMPGEDNPPEHEHSYADSWSKDET